MSKDRKITRENKLLGREPKPIQIVNPLDEEMLNILTEWGTKDLTPYLMVKQLKYGTN